MPTKMLNDMFEKHGKENVISAMSAATDLRKRKEQEYKQAKIVDKVNQYKAIYPFALSGQMFIGHVRDKINRGEFNQCVYEMSNHAGSELFERYVRVKKQLLEPVEKPLEWVNGDDCIYSQDSLVAYKYVGYSTVSKNLSVVMDSTQNVKLCYTSELSKPLTAEQKEAKEREDFIVNVSKIMHETGESSINDITIGSLFDAGVKLPE